MFDILPCFYIPTGWIFFYFFLVKANFLFLGNPGSRGKHFISSPFIGSNGSSDFDFDLFIIFGRNRVIGILLTRASLLGFSKSFSEKMNNHMTRE